jgi:TM2 domain-containing membrane protein YozV
MSDKPSLEDLGLDAPIAPPKATKSWQDIANEVDDSPRDRRTCPHCGSTIPSSATKCSSCQEWIRKPPAKWNGLAAVLSFFIPGLGQMYKGEVIKGLVFFIGMSAVSGIGLVFWPILIVAMFPWIFIFVEAGTASK